MTQPKVEKQPIYVLPEMGIKMPKKAETPAKEIKIPFLAEGQKPYVSPYADFNGIDVEKSLVKKVRTYGAGAIIELKDNTEYYYYGLSNGVKKGAKSRIYKDADNATVFSNLDSGTIYKNSDKDKYKLIDSEDVAVCSIISGTSDTLQIENCKRLEIEKSRDYRSEKDKKNKKHETVLMDNAKDLSKKPSLMNSTISGEGIKNNLFWTQDVKESK